MSVRSTILNPCAFSTQSLKVILCSLRPVYIIIIIIIIRFVLKFCANFVCQLLNDEARYFDAGVKNVSKESKRSK